MRQSAQPFRPIRALFLLVFILHGMNSALASNVSDGVLGTWLVESATGDPAHIEIYSQFEDGVETFYGKFIFFPGEDENGVNIGESALDSLNPDEALRGRRLIGMNMLEGMTFDQDNVQWDGGTVYDPDIGKYYKCRLTLKDANHLELRGYIGIPLFGRSEIWIRLGES